MTRDQGLFALVGMLVGFIGGYMMHEVMAARQPARLPAGSNPAMSAPAPPAAAGQAASPEMEQIQQLSAYVSQNPDDLQAAVTLANFAFDAQMWPRAAELYERYLAANPNDPDVLTDLGVCRREMGEPEAALALFNQAMAASPDHWQSRFNQIVVLTFDLARFDEARLSLAQLERMQPGHEAVGRLGAELERLSGEAGG